MDLKNIKNKIKDKEYAKGKTDIEIIKELFDSIKTSDTVYIPIEKDIVYAPFNNDNDGNEFISFENIHLLDDKQIQAIQQSIKWMEEQIILRKRVIHLYKHKKSMTREIDKTKEIKVNQLEYENYVIYPWD